MASLSRTPNTDSQLSIHKLKFNNPAKATLVIDNFQNVIKQPGKLETKVFTLPTNDQIQFELRCLTKYAYSDSSIICGDCVWIYLYLNKSNQNQVAVRYRISIESDDAIKESKNGRANFSMIDEKHRYGARWYVNHAFLFDIPKGLFDRDMIIIYCVVEEIYSSNLVIPNVLNKMSEDFDVLLESGKLSDAVLVADGKELHIHKAIVGARSPVFTAMFSHDSTKEARENRVEITDVDFEVLEQLLKYIYTGKIEELDGYAADLLIAADKYRLECLKVICEQHLLSKITIESASRLFLLADMHHATELTIKCLEYITENGTEVMASEGWKDIMLKPDLLAKVCERFNSKYSNVKSKK